MESVGGYQRSCVGRKASSEVKSSETICEVKYKCHKYTAHTAGSLLDMGTNN